ncbi:hypothetical protein BKH45_01790 [Helicobacter sp. 11S03491-1]|nr:hypothetical protein BKH45_01790 [Helicobacter sp. 11S03491-1]
MDSMDNPSNILSNPHKANTKSNPIPASIIQKPTDKPKDKAIMLNSSGVKTCYIPIFQPNGGFVEILNCDDPRAIPARYDVFQRISYHINDVWVCLSAPTNVTDGTTQWDYIYLSPCAINTPNQRWIIKDNAFWTADGKYRIKSTTWLYLTKDSADKHDHTLDDSMKEWLATIATPGNISIRTSIGWNFVESSKMERYYIGNNRSWDSYVWLYYNPDNGHIAQYDGVSGSLYCMKSQINTYDWNWVSWELCSDAPSTKDDSAYWDVSFTTPKGGAITDYKKNALRVTKYGSNWGVPYTAKLDYLQKDTTNSPTSIFFLDQDLQRWVRYVNGNLGETLSYCPAPGAKSQKNTTLSQTPKVALPPDFRLNDDWIRRLWAIARTTNQVQQVSGICGVCLLQSYQMIAELETHYPGEPPGRRGFFFDIASSSNPFDSFAQRFPDLNDELRGNLVNWSNTPLYPGESLADRDARLFWASSRAMLPQFDWFPSQYFLTRVDVIRHLQTLLDSPVGNAWIASIRMRTPTQTVGHALVILRTTDGLSVVQTNLETISRANFAQSVTPTTDLDRIFGVLFPYPIVNFMTLQVRDPSRVSPMNEFVSNNNCTGDGEDRRGSLTYPSATSINQCSQGRCAYPLSQ